MISLLDRVLGWSARIFDRAAMPTDEASRVWRGVGAAAEAEQHYAVVPTVVQADKAVCVDDVVVEPHSGCETSDRCGALLLAAPMCCRLR